MYQLRDSLQLDMEVVNERENKLIYFQKALFPVVFL